MKRKLRTGLVTIFSLAVLVSASTRLPADTGTCGGTSTALPFTDLAGNVFFCQIAEALFSGLTNGTTSTTYTPLGQRSEGADGGLRHQNTSRSLTARKSPSCPGSMGNVYGCANDRQNHCRSKSAGGEIGWYRSVGCGPE
jgi:hypothetical protein